MNADLVEAAQIAGAKGRRIVLGIVLPVTTPALIAAGSRFALPGRCRTLPHPRCWGCRSGCRPFPPACYGMIEVGQTARGYVIGILLVSDRGAVPVGWATGPSVGQAQSYATITGKGGRAKRFDLGPARWPLFGVAALILTLCQRGASDRTDRVLRCAPPPRQSFSRTGPCITGSARKAPRPSRKGRRASWHNPDILRATGISIALAPLRRGRSAWRIGLLVSYATTRHRAGWLSAAIVSDQLSARS